MTAWKQLSATEGFVMITPVPLLCLQAEIFFYPHKTTAMNDTLNAPLDGEETPEATPADGAVAEPEESAEEPEAAAE